MTTQEQAEKLAMDAAGRIYVKAKINRINEYSMRDDILSTIPLKEMLDAIEALRKAKWWMDTGSNDSCTCNVSEHCSYCSKASATSSKIDKALDALDAKLKGKV